MTTPMIVVPTVLFLVFVAPLWLILHYRFKSRMTKGISESELNDLEAMLASVDKLAQRVETLETILDEKNPDWKNSTR